MQEDKKIAIIGGGLSGLSLGFQLYKKGISFEIITKKENFSSVIAAGLINPIVFRRTTKSWEVDTFLPFAKEFYKEVESEIGEGCWHDLAIRRSFSHDQEADDWTKKKTKDNYSDYLGAINSESPEALYKEYGTGVVKQGAWIDTHHFIYGLRDFFETKGLLKYGDVKELYNEKELTEKFSAVIFCEGYEMIHNDDFNYLPLDPTKGQTLLIHSEEIPANESINRKCFVLPVGNNHYKVGATYEWSNATLNCTAEARKQLEDDLKNLIQSNYTVVEQEAGVRPTVKDRRPLLGQHPHKKNLYIFNGLGAKGYLIAPYMAKEMCDFLVDGKPLMKEVNIQRYETLFGSKFTS